jgi:hypothetical protein
MMTTNLAIKEPDQLATLPEHLRGEVGNKAGKDNVNRDDILIPRLGLAQALSPQLKKSNEAYIPELRPGQFFNSVTGEIYGEEVQIVPLFFFRSFIQFNPISAGGGIVKMYGQDEMPPASDLAFIDGKQPVCTEFKNRMSLLLKNGTFDPVVVSFKSTGLKAARRWNFLIAEKNLPAYAFVYDFAVKTLSGKGNEWFGCDIARGEYTPAALFEQAKQYFSDLQGKGIQVDLSGLEPEGQPIEDGGPTPF